jgi:hypothetical protein
MKRVSSDLKGNSVLRWLFKFVVRQSFSGDGLIAAVFFPQDLGLCIPRISRTETAPSLLPEA